MSASEKVDRRPQTDSGFRNLRTGRSKPVTELRNLSVGLGRTISAMEAAAPEPIPTIQCGCPNAAARRRSRPSAAIASVELNAPKQTLSAPVQQPSPLLAPGHGTPILAVAFGAIVGHTEHLAILSRTSAALAPCRNVVRVHFGELPYLALIGSMAECAEWTI